MFKSIEYKLLLYLLLLIASVAATTYLVVTREYVYVGLCAMVGIYSLTRLYGHYQKFNQNILFLLNALDNGDYSFHFAESKISVRERELNQMMNRIKEILTHARKEVIENEKFLSLILENVSTGIIILDPNNNIQATNRATNQLLGLPVFTHLNQLKAVDESFPELFRALEVKDNTQIKITNEREEVQVSLRVSKIKLKKGTTKIITLNNIGNELEAKEMESWIRLIRVMTHEIMNSIAPITSLTETLLFGYRMQGDTSTDDSLKENTVEALHTISSTAKGLMTFVDSYRKFTGVPIPQLRPFELMPLLEKVLHLEYSAMQEKGVESSIVASDRDIVLTADEGQITQILVNIIKNAIEAMHNTDGKIKIKVSRTEDKLSIDVCNNGDPIPPEIAAHIFIPFFTTKDYGTGIGLSVSRYIMRLHGGNLKHHTVNEWTIFSLIFNV